MSSVFVKRKAASGRLSRIRIHPADLNGRVKAADMLTLIGNVATPERQFGIPAIEQKTDACIQDFEIILQRERVQIAIR